MLPLLNEGLGFIRVPPVARTKYFGAADSDNRHSVASLAASLTKSLLGVCSDMTEIEALPQDINTKVYSNALQANPE